MSEVVTARLRWIVAVLLVGAGVIVFRLLTIQFGSNVIYFNEIFTSVNQRPHEYVPRRGRILDREGELLATSETQYELSLAPPFVTDPESVASILSDVLDRSVQDIQDAAVSDQTYVLIQRPIPSAVGEKLLALGKDPQGPNLSGVTLDPLPHRVYPGGTLAAQVLGFVGYDNQGYYGVEEYYDDILRGQPVQGTERTVPFDVALNPDPRNGSDLYLTIDRDVQSAVEEALANGIRSSGAASGSILVMDPQNGEILAMAAWPSFDPNNFQNANADYRNNPIISEQFEPGSTFKVLTMAAALQSGVATPETTYVDQGFIEAGGALIRNWDGRAYGVQDMLGLLQHSLNVGAATITAWMGAPTFYSYLDAFGIGQTTNVDLAGEAGGNLRHPGDPHWYESDLGVNAFGQGVAVTPLQLLTAISAVANDGAMMQPHILRQVADGDSIHTTQPQVLGRPISPDTAQTLTQMLSVSLEREASSALVPGYRIAGKTGTAQIPLPGGYDAQRTIASFVGWGPVDDPRFIVLIKLDAPTTAPWGSVVAAPVFSQLAQRLVILLEIPPDNVRQSLAAEP